MFKSWKSSLPLAVLPTKTQEPPLWYLSGRLLLLVLTSALCPALRASLWATHRRDLSLLNLVRHLQAIADGWLQRLFASAAALRAFRHHGCLKADRLVTKAVRKRRTSAQRLRESGQAQNDGIELTIKLAA